MYTFIKILLVVICVSCILYMIKMNNKYRNDTSSTKEDIINYFKEKNATSLESGIRVKELPRDISKNPYLLMMVKDETLVFKKGKYYLNDK